MYKYLANEYVKKQAEDNKMARKLKNEGYLEASSAGMCHKKHYYRRTGATPKEITSFNESNTVRLNGFT